MAINNSVESKAGESAEVINLSILGAGSWGLTLAHMLGQKPGYSVRVFCRNQERSARLSQGVFQRFCDDHAAPTPTAPAALELSAVPEFSAAPNTDGFCSRFESTWMPSWPASTKRMVPPNTHLNVARSSTNFLSWSVMHLISLDHWPIGRGVQSRRPLGSTGLLFAIAPQPRKGRM